MTERQVASQPLSQRLDGEAGDDRALTSGSAHCGGGGELARRAQGGRHTGRAATPMVAGRGRLRQQLSAAVPPVQTVDIWSGEQTVRKDDDEIYMRM
jgi:hypothetical protein